MDYHVCKERRNSSPESVMNCNNASGSGGLGQDPDTKATTSSPGSVRPLNLQICPTTGGLFRLDISENQTVHSLKKQISKKLGLSQDKISLLHKERLLKDGTLLDNQITDGSRITLLPNVETGLMSSPPELSVMQALESLSEGQVNDFLTGKSPLTLAMRLGNHVMFLQLQLSTVSPSTKRVCSGMVTPPASRGRQHHQNSSTSSVAPVGSPATSSSSSPSSSLSAGLTSGRPLPDGVGEEVLRSRLKLPTMLTPPLVMTPPPSPKSPSGSYPGTYCYPSVGASLCPSPCPPSGSARHVVLDPTNTPPPSPCYSQKLVPDLPMVQVNDKATSSVEVGDNVASTSTSSTGSVSGQMGTCSRPVVNNSTPGARHQDNSERFMPFLDSSTLTEAKKSLSMKLKEYSDHTRQAEKLSDSPSSGAVIESMQKLGRGVYSGTFSGTLNSALQDHEGKPKRSVSTIVHILNDLLGATPPHPGRPFVKNNNNNNNSTSSTTHHRNLDDSSRFEKEKEEIRGKVQHLQIMMEERRRRRLARRHHRAAPYPSPQKLEVTDPGIRNGADHSAAFPPEDMDLV